MAPKEKLETDEVEASEVTDEREMYLRDGKRLVVGESGANQLVEIRSESGLVELRIELTPAGPILRMHAVKLELKADQQIALESPQVAIRGGEVKIESEDTIDVDAKGDVRVVGKIIHLN
jgi:hypothetical protein